MELCSHASNFGCLEYSWFVHSEQERLGQRLGWRDVSEGFNWLIFNKLLHSWSLKMTLITNLMLPSQDRDLFEP